MNRPGGIPAMRVELLLSPNIYVAKAMLIRRWNARLVWGMQRQAASQIMATWRANAFLRSCQGSCGGGSARASSASGPARPALDDGRSHEYDLDSLD